MIAIQTPRLDLRLMQWDDVDPLLGVFGDPAVMDAFATHPFARDQMEGWVRRNLQHQDTYGYGLFTLILRETGLILGDCGIEHMELGGELVAELGYDLRSDHWGQGLATEAAAAVRDFAFDSVQLPRLVSLIRDSNRASQRVAEKIGMRLTVSPALEDPNYQLFSLSREDWLAR